MAKEDKKDKKQVKETKEVKEDKKDKKQTKETKEDKKETKPAKKDKKDDGDTAKEDKVNQATAKSGGIFNVTRFKTWVKEHYATMKLSSETPDKMSGIHHMLGATTEVVCSRLLSDLSDKMKKSKSGLLDIDVDALMNHIKLTPYLNYTYGNTLAIYDPSAHYVKQLPVDESALDKYVEKHVFNNNSSVTLSSETKNLVAYLLVKTLTFLSETSLYMVKYKNEKSTTMSGKAVLYAVKVHFTGLLLSDLTKKLENVLNLLKNTQGDKDTKSEDKSSKDKKKDKNDKKDTKKKDKKDESDDESESDNDGSDEDGSDEDGSDGSGSDSDSD